MKQLRKSKLCSKIVFGLLSVLTAGVAHSAHSLSTPKYRDVNELRGSLQFDINLSKSVFQMHDRVAFLQTEGAVVVPLTHEECFAKLEQISKLYPQSPFHIIYGNGSVHHVYKFCERKNLEWGTLDISLPRTQRDLDKPAIVATHFLREKDFENKATLNKTLFLDAQGKLVAFQESLRFEEEIKQDSFRLRYFLNNGDAVYWSERRDSNGKLKSSKQAWVPVDGILGHVEQSQTYENEIVTATFMRLMKAAAQDWSSFWIALTFVESNGIYEYGSITQARPSNVDLLEFTEKNGNETCIRGTLYRGEGRQLLPESSEVRCKL